MFFTKKFKPKELRDELAMAALTGIVSLDPDVLIKAKGSIPLSIFQFAAMLSYDIADAMLEAREENQLDKIKKELMEKNE